MQTTTTTDVMRERWRKMGEEWLREHPVMEPPAGFVLDPTMVGPDREAESQRHGWFLIGTDPEQPDEVTLYRFADLGEVARSLIIAHVSYDTAVTRIELWDGDCCLWAAKRS